MCIRDRRPSVSFHYPEGRFDKLFPSLWRTSGLTATLRKEHVDLFHGLSNEIPMNLKQNGIPAVVTIHDLIFLRYPQLYKPIDRSIYTYKFKQACLRSDKIIAISRQTMRDIRDFFNIPESKIEVVYQGCDPIFGQAVQEDVKSVSYTHLPVPAGHRSLPYAIGFSLTHSICHVHQILLTSSRHQTLWTPSYKTDSFSPDSRR